jgi:ABC-type phosphate transport system substrate-binding protein
MKTPSRPPLPKPRRRHALATAMAGMFAVAPPAPAETAVIVNPKNMVTRMPVAEAAQYFLGKSSLLTPVDLAESSPLRSDFYMKIAGKDQDQVKAIWSKIVFTGKGFPPKEYNTSAEVKKAIAADPAAIGYIDRSAVDNTVKVILILQ